MKTLTRRSFLQATAVTPIAPAAGVLVAAPRQTDIRIREVRHSYENYLYRTPIKFGGTVLDRVTLLNVDVVVALPNGKTQRGFGSMPLGNIWAYPSKTMSYEQTLGAMQELTDRIRKITADYNETAHPVDINHVLEPAYLKAAAEISKKLKEPIPKLATLVVASAFDAAIHDAFGKIHNRSTYATYGPDLMAHDLSHYLGKEFKGEYLEKYVSKTPKPAMPLYHLVGAVDPVFPEEVKKPVGDGLPEHLAQWIEYSGLTHIKIKLNGEDLKWDLERVLAVNKVAEATQAKRKVSKWYYSLDFNEKCPNVGYLIDMLRQVKQKAPAGFERIQYIEQPTKRDLKADRANVMHEASKLRPVVIDESLTELESLLLAREMGYTGAALKACKGQAQALLMAAAAQKFKMFLCVQDLTCPGASLIHSAGIAAHVPTVAAIEANSRQYCPAANKGWDKKFPGMFDIRDGMCRTSQILKLGLGAVA
jgi:L-alanine-DL-glutamate epimerase-like enolase superfamily enzyme